MPLPCPVVPVSWGELIDKLTILRIKGERITRADARVNVERERALLETVAAPAMDVAGVAEQTAELGVINEALWDIEDAIRDEEAAGRFEARFVELARAVYRTNDARAAIKRRINDLLGSELIEEKSYADWQAVTAGVR
jgi:hypothetical protein